MLRLGADPAAAWTALRRGDAAAAEAICARILAEQPDHAEALHLLAVLRLRARRSAEAAALCRTALRYAPTAAPIWSTLGTALQTQRVFDDAIAAHRRALELDPGLAGLRFNLANALREAGQPEAAAEAYRAVLATTPARADALANLGGVLCDLERFDEALEVCRQATAADPSRAVSWLNLAVAARALGGLPETIAALERAVALRPDYALAQHNLGLACLLREDFGRGFAAAEWRWQLPEFAPMRADLPQPRWPGPGATGGLVTYGEQGVGEEILHAGLVPEALAAAQPLVLIASDRLRPLFQRSLPAATVVARSTPPHPAATDPAIAWQCPTASLGAFFRRSAADFPARRSYLRADPARTATLRTRYAEMGRGPAIGLSWRSVNARMGEASSSALLDWEPILRAREAIFVNLQYGDCRADLAALRERGVIVHQDPAIDPLADLDGFAAQCAAMDLVITTGNSTAHMTGALGVPGWVLLPHGFGLVWYWFLEREDSPWYPSLRLFRQQGEHGWAAVIARIAAALRDFVPRTESEQQR